ncbi:hypothetical protein MKY27_07625 [Solibacillus sp. FSL R5-0449]|uniref:YxiG family protein n=1 Tax=Solibacillus sp. FSL R5-0449 TaxID=2921639 RepID=UPI0030D21943
MKNLTDIPYLLEHRVNGWEISSLDINYFAEMISLLVESVSGQNIIKTYVTFKEVLSYYIYQETVVYDQEANNTYRLNTRKFNDTSFVSEIGYHQNGFGKVKIETLNPDLRVIEDISSKTNFYFQVNNKDHFFIEANQVQINDETFCDLLQSSESLKIQ